MLRCLTRTLPHIPCRTLASHISSPFLPPPSFLFLHRSFASFQIIVPSLGDSITEGTVVEVSKKAGDSVSTDEVVARLETDKVSVDLRSSGDGKITQCKAKEGDVVHPGDVVFEAEGTEGGGGGGGEKPAESAAPQQPKEKQKEAQPSPPPAASPSPSPSTSPSFDPPHRHPMIQFRYGKRPTSSFHPDPTHPSFTQSTSSTSSQTPPLSSPSSKSPAGMGEYFRSEGWREGNEAAAQARSGLPYVRRVMTEREQEMIMMGGAEPYIPTSVLKAMEKEKAKAGGDKGGKKK